MLLPPVIFARSTIACRSAGKFERTARNVKQTEVSRMDAYLSARERRHAVKGGAEALEGDRERHGGAAVNRGLHLQHRAWA